MKRMSYSDSRYKRSIERVAAEAFWLKTYQNALCGLTVTAIGLDFFRVSMNALKDARLIRLIRILEDDSKVASLWYIFKSNERRFYKAAKEVDFDVDLARRLADKFIGIRNKTFVHIDKQGVFDPGRLYDEAGITHNDLDRFIRTLWPLMEALHLDVLGHEVKGDDYSGEDIAYLASLRDQNGKR